MTAITYPAALPGPISAPIQATERRQLSSEPGPRASRVLSRDRLANQQCSFMFTLAQAEIFNAWWCDTLYEGGAWFASNWPHPQTSIAVRKFVGVPKWGDYVPGALWPVTADFEVRGRGTNPAVIERFIVALDGSDNAGGFIFGGFIPTATPGERGVVLSLDPTRTYRLTLAADSGAWSGFPYDGYPGDGGLPWTNRLEVTDPSGVTSIGIFGGSYATAAAAVAAWPNPGPTITGHTDYCFWLEDTNPGDNRGSLTVLVTEVI